MATSVSQPKKRARTGQGKAMVTRSGKTAVVHAHKKAGSAEPVPLRIQECSFVKWHVSGITSVAASPTGRHIATARSNGNLELRDKDAQWLATSVIYADSSTPDESVTAMEFSNCGRYLFVARLAGSLAVFRLTIDGLVNHTLVHPGGGAIWDLSVSRDAPSETLRVAVACDDGCVRVITPDPSFVNLDEGNPLPSNPAHYEIMASERTTARVLCVSWAPLSFAGEDGCIACGDEDGGIRWLNASNGAPYGKGKITGLRQNKVMIWTLQFVHDGRELICGDSRGFATVWSSSTNTMTGEQWIEGTKGALWSSSAIASEGRDAEFVFFGSAGGGIAGLKRTHESESWTPVRGMHLHTHDVRSLSCLPDGTVVSGSMDSLMRLFSPSALIDKKNIQWIRPYSGSIGQANVQFAAWGKVILSRFRKAIEIWSIGEDSVAPALRLRMNLSSFSSDVRACAVSEDLTHIAVSGADEFKLYRIWDGNGDFSKSLTFGKVDPIELSAKVGAQLRGCIDATFCGNILVCLTKCRKRVMFLDAVAPTMPVASRPWGKEAFSSKLAGSKSKIAVSDTRGNVYCCNLGDSFSETEGQPKWHMVFAGSGKPAKPATAFAFSKSGKKLAVCTTAFRTHIIDPDGGEELQVSDLDVKSPVHTISFSEHETSILASGHDFCLIRRTISLSTQGKHMERNSRKCSSSCILPYHDSIISSSVVGPSRIAIVRRRWNQVVPSLPEAIPKRPFGT